MTQDDILNAIASRAVQIVRVETDASYTFSVGVDGDDHPYFTQGEFLDIAIKIASTAIPAIGDAMFGGLIIGLTVDSDGTLGGYVIDTSDSTTRK